jgi:hypothetical protein
MACSDGSPAFEKDAERRLDLAADATRMMAAGFIADRIAQRRGSSHTAYVGASERWVAAHPIDAAAAQATLAFVSQIAARIVTLRNQAPTDDDRDRDSERMTNEGGARRGGRFDEPGTVRDKGHSVQPKLSAHTRVDE